MLRFLPRRWYNTGYAWVRRGRNESSLRVGATSAMTPNMDNPSPDRALCFRSYPASRRLSPFVRNFWTMSCESALVAPFRHRVLPDGCIDMIFVRRGSTEDYSALVVGTMTRPLFTELAGHVDYLGVRFAPGGFRHLFDVPPGRLTDRTVPLDDLSAWSGLAEQVTRSGDTRARLDRLETALARRLAPEPPDSRLAAVLRTIAACQGNVTIARLARVADCTPRHLRRTFGAAVGVGPRTFCRIVRFRAALRALRRRPRPDLLAVALDAGYYDQAHFIHEFDEFYGASPSAAARDPAF
jgi:AraC-like DNA-binding protein